MTQTGAPERRPMQVDFGYAFATPHRLTVALPDSSDKTLLDAQIGLLRMSWTYDNLLDKPLAAFVTPRTGWEVLFKPELDGQPFTRSEWRRAEGWLPVLENVYDGEGAVLRMEVVGGASAAIIRVEVENLDTKPRRLALRCERPGGWSGYNPAWVQGEWDHDVLLAGWADRADRIVIFAVGGDEQPVLAPTTLCMAWNLGPGEKRVGWIVRPYRAYHSILPVLRSRDWAAEFQAGKAAWRSLIARSTQVSIPDSGVRNAFYAALADCFIMREPVADGYVAASPGTEQYRAPNPYEPAIVAVLLDQVGLHAESALGYQMCLDQQGPDGNWSDPLGWAHYMWGSSGLKSWAVLEHYRLTGDKAYLAGAYPRMLASSRWQESQRARTRVAPDGQRPLVYGLLPRGMGDGGLMGEDGSYYGVFLTHNFLAVYADAMTIEAAEVLGRTEDLAELRRIHRTALEDLLVAVEKGAIAEDGYRWISGVPGHTCGSRWGALYAALPCGILPPDHELISGTIRKIEARISPGGIPVHTGWMKDGMWVAITLDNLAEVLLLRDEGDAAARYLYATLNHGTPLYSWCEERGQEPGAKDCSGDRQHLWTPVAVGRFIRDALVMEQGDTLHLARGTARQWLAGGGPLGVQGAPTHFGRVSYEVRFDGTFRRVEGLVELASSAPAPRVVLHVRLPHGMRITSVCGERGPAIDGEGTVIEWRGLRGRESFEAEVGP